MQSGYIKFILTVLTLVIIVAAYLIITALDRVRESNYHLADTLKELKGQGAIAAGPKESAAAAPEKQKAPGKSTGVIANSVFYSPEAVTGGRIIRATEAEAGNLNPLTSNEAMASAFNGYCSSTLGTRNYAKPELWEPLMAESWQISDDRKSYRIKLRRGILWQDTV